MKFPAPGIVAVFLALSGCMTVGTRFDIESADRLSPGISTIEDATRLLGPAKTESTYGDNSKLLQWQYVQGTVVGGHSSHLAILFDRNGRMIRITHKSKI